MLTESHVRGSGAAGTSAAAASEGGSDPRLQAPKRRDLEVSFRPGTATWNTDAPTHEEQVQRRQEEDARDGRMARVREIFKERSQYIETNFTTGEGHLACPWRHGRSTGSSLVGVRDG